MNNHKYKNEQQTLGITIYGVADELEVGLFGPQVRVPGPNLAPPELKPGPIAYCWDQRQSGSSKTNCNGDAQLKARTHARWHAHFFT